MCLGYWWNLMINSPVFFCCVVNYCYYCIFQLFFLQNYCFIIMDIFLQQQYNHLENNYNYWFYCVFLWMWTIVISWPTKKFPFHLIHKNYPLLTSTQQCNCGGFCVLLVIIIYTLLVIFYRNSFSHKIFYFFVLFMILKNVMIIYPNNHMCDYIKTIWNAKFFTLPPCVCVCVCLLCLPVLL